MPDAATYEQADPLTQVPLDVPVWAVHARDDDTVPFSQAEAYVDAATARAPRPRSSRSPAATST